MVCVYNLFTSEIPWCVDKCITAGWWWYSETSEITIPCNKFQRHFWSVLSCSKKHSISCLLHANCGANTHRPVQCCHSIFSPYNKNEKSLHFPTQSETKNAIIFSCNIWPCNATYYIRCIIKSARSKLLYMCKTSIITLTESTTA